MVLGDADFQEVKPITQVRLWRQYHPDDLHTCLEEVLHSVVADLLVRNHLDDQRHVHKNQHKVLGAHDLSNDSVTKSIQYQENWKCAKAPNILIDGGYRCPECSLR